MRTDFVLGNFLASIDLFRQVLVILPYSRLMKKNQEKIRRNSLTWFGNHSDERFICSISSGRRFLIFCKHWRDLVRVLYTSSSTLTPLKWYELPCLSSRSEKGYSDKKPRRRDIGNRTKSVGKRKSYLLVNVACTFSTTLKSGPI